MDDRRIQRAKEAVFDEVRFLAPGEVHQLFVQLAEATKKLADDYDRDLQNVICS